MTEKTKADEQSKDRLEITGVIERVVYRNEQNGYTVCELDNDGELITAVGLIPFAAEGETIHAFGSWETHSTFGRQFKVMEYEKTLPATEAAILKYLSSRTVKGLGPITASKIVEKYGADSFDVIENHPEWLAELPGITLKKAEEISDNFRAQSGIRSVMMFCKDTLGPGAAMKVYKKWGTNSVEILKANPYVLCNGNFGIGFDKADRLAKQAGCPKNSPDRIAAGMKYVLSYNAQNNGHVYIPNDRLLPTTAQLLEVSAEAAERALSTLVADGEVFVEDIRGRSVAYLRKYYYAERDSASRLDLLDRLCPRLDAGDVERFIVQVESEESIRYATLQRKAIIGAINNGVMVLTGGPGTGKTTVIRAVIRLFDRMGLKVALAAPTGRAAKRASETAQREAKTIHRLLEMEYSDESDEPRFNRDADNPIEEDAIIIDEASMVDIMLLSALVRAIKPGARLLLIGDSDQLPSVGPGNVLNDILKSERFATVKLTEIFRQAKESVIITNAHSINHGEYPQLNIKDNDFFFLKREEDEAIAKTVADLCANRLPRTYGEAVRANIQVITPSRKGAVGTEMLNIRLQNVLNAPDPVKKEKKVHGVTFREGDKVMQIRNNYDIKWEKDGREGVGIFNGDIGHILEIGLREETVKISFDGRLAIYDFTMLDELDHAYAITVHKSQGSEYPIVVIPVYRYSPKLLTRNLLYTAVTRAQEMVVMVGRQDVVMAMVDNNVQAKRYTGLAYRLEATMDEDSQG